MKRVLGIAVVIAIFVVVPSQAEDGLKVFISADMEGVCGVINWEDVGRDGKDYPLFRELMTEEVNAAIEGAVAAGATEIVVRDSHGSARNILPDLLRPEADLIRDWSGGPLSMMEGIDDSFDAVIFIGYHAREGMPDAVLKHTMTGRIDVILNGTNMPEAGINGAIAGYFGVPVVMVAGDLALTEQAKELFGEAEAVAVKQAIGKAARMMHPSKARTLITDAATRALSRVDDFSPMKLSSPVTMEIRFKHENDAARASWFPAATRTGERSVAYTHEDLMEVLKFFMFVH